MIKKAENLDSRNKFKKKINLLFKFLVCICKVSYDKFLWIKYKTQNEPFD